MDLATLLKEHPELAAEIAGIEADAKEEGRKEMAILYEKASPFIANADYPASIAETAKKVIAGEEKVETLLGAVAGVDAYKAAQSEADAGDESGEETPPEPPPTLSEDGTINSEDDYQAALETHRQMSGN